MKAITRGEKELDKLLHHKTNYSFAYLKDVFKFKDDTELFNFLTLYLSKKLDDYNFESDVKNNKYLSKTTKYFGYSLGKISINNKNVQLVINELNTINNKIKKLVASNSSKHSTNNCTENCIYLLNLEKRIENIISDILDKVSFSDKIEIITDNKLCELTKDIVFTYKNSRLLEVMLENFPNIVLLKDYDDKFLLDKILDRHFNSLFNKHDYYEKLYYDKVIDLFMNCSYLSDDNILEELFYTKIQTFIVQLSKKDIDKTKLTYIMSDINERINQYESGNKIDFLDKKEQNNYYDNINFDLLSNLTASNKHEERKDLFDRYIITIDNDNAKVFENAVSLEETADNKYLLSIYAVDISYFISENQQSEKKKYENILEKGNEIYFKKKYKLENFNLVKDKKVPVIAYQFLVDKDMNLEHFTFERAYIKVSDNLKFSDFDNVEDIESEKTKEVVTNLINLVFPEIEDINDVNSEVIDDMNYKINNFASLVMAEYCDYKNLPLIYRRDVKTNYEEIINELEEKHKIDLSFLKYSPIMNIKNTLTIGNETLYDENGFNISIFSPARKAEALINQMLINVYLVDHEKLDEYTKNYLQTRLDKIVLNLNKNKINDEKYNINNELASIKQSINGKVLKR